ncbi:MAG: stage II sporulation protein M [Desulfatibacillum sp.]|nr:stage II sporulation protein M [Desulfatibacillum sp.]
MIIDLQKFIKEQRPAWTRLEKFLDLLERNQARRLSLDEVREFHTLYQRASADLARIATFSSEQSVRRYLETLVARAYAEIYESRKKGQKLSPFKWFFITFPRTFRKHIAAFWVALLITMIGGAFGGVALMLDSEAKEVIMPWSHLTGSPAERVQEEETAEEDRLAGRKASFSSQLMVNNISVSLRAVAFGMTWGIGTILLLFYNGIILGAVAVDYIAAGQTRFLLGWLLPHGSVEIPSILIAGQAGFMLAQALIGRNDPGGLKQRMKNISADVINLVGGLAVLLVWAGIIESYMSQYHEPVLPYWLKITFGSFQLLLLFAFLGWSGRNLETVAKKPQQTLAGG